MTYRARVSAPAGFKVKVSPSKITLRRGQSATFTVTVTNVSAPIDAWRFGSLTWVSNDYKVRSPIAVKGALFDAPEEVAGTGTAGSVSFPVKFGYTGAYTAAAHGLVQATSRTTTSSRIRNQTFAPGDVATGGANLHQFTLSDAALFRSRSRPTAPKRTPTSTSTSSVRTARSPAARPVAPTSRSTSPPRPTASWKVYVHGWSTPGGDSDYDMWTWAIPATPGGGIALDHVGADLGDERHGRDGRGRLERHHGRNDRDWYLGAVSHTGPTGLMGLTLVNVDNRP